jgi:hypothetical protein
METQGLENAKWHTFEGSFILHNPLENLHPLGYIYAFQVKIYSYQHWWLITGNKF